jgi:hypothetical protein
MLRKSLLILLIAALCSLAIAADQSSATSSTQPTINARTLHSVPTLWPSGVNPAKGYTFDTAPPNIKLDTNAHGTWVPGYLHGDVCLTMRMYKVKRTERIFDSERAFRGYTTCEMASNYQIRTSLATRQVKEPVKPGPHK